MSYSPVVIHHLTTLSVDLLLDILDDWIVHCAPSGYMHRDVRWTSIQQICRLYGAYAGNNKVLYFNGHDLHWDSDALDMMSNACVHSFFLNVGDSTNNQKSINGVTKKVKSYYNNKKAFWDDEYSSTPFSPPMIKTVMVKMWARLVCGAGKTIKHSFAVTNLLPLKPPSMSKAAAHTYVSVMQIGTGEKVSELDIVCEKMITPVPIKVLTTTDSYGILRAKKPNSVILSSDQLYIRSSTNPP